MIEINVLGKACPIPVIETKKAIKSSKENETILTKVDNEIATQNLEKMVKELGLNDYSINKINDQLFEFNLNIGTGSIENQNIENSNQNIIVINSNKMGSGPDDILGKKLLEGFIYALTEGDVFPDTIIFYNSGVYIPTTSEKSIEDLKTLEENGTKILSCGLCLNTYDLTEKLAIGEVTNMYTISSILMSAKKVIYV